jgi:hypothetical protein
MSKSSKYTDLQIDDVKFWAGGITIQWSSQSLGFGEVIISKDEQQEVTIDSEHMSRDFVKALFIKLADDASF